MSTVFTVLTVLVIIASVLITLIVLLQNGKGGGLASNFVTGNQTFGVRQTADILEKITWGLVIFVFVISVASAFVLGGDKTDGDGTLGQVTEKVQEEQAAQAQEAPLALPSADVALPDVSAAETAETDK